MSDPVLPEFKLIVAGGRDFDDADLLSRVIYALADVEFAEYEVSIVSGMARGADALGYMLAHQLGIKVYEFHADWNRHGKSAGFKRNAEMGEFSDGLLAFWDGKSTGTKGMIDFMLAKGKKVVVVEY